MSIINEALKKTEEDIQRSADKKNARADIKKPKNTFLLYALILLTGLFFGNLIFNLLSHKIKTGATENKTIVTPAQTIPLAPPAIASPALPVEEKTAPPSLVLNGIFFSDDDDGYALVNNQIVRENESVDGVLVKKITASSVELDNRGEIITLSTQR